MAEPGREIRGEVCPSNILKKIHIRWLSMVELEEMDWTGGDVPVVEAFANTYV
jgi:hypothetical protein